MSGVYSLGINAVGVLQGLRAHGLGSPVSSLGNSDTEFKVWDLGSGDAGSGFLGVGHE